MSGKPATNFTIYLGVGGCQSIQSHVVDAIPCTIPSTAALGEGSLASHPFGSDLSPFNQMPYINEMWTRFDPILQYYFAALELECTTTNHSYAWLTMGLNMVLSDTGNNEFIPPEIISMD